jgi:hypothetical protein
MQTIKNNLKKSIKEDPKATSDIRLLCSMIKNKNHDLGPILSQLKPTGKRRVMVNDNP